MQNINTDKESQQFHIASVEIFYVLEEKVAATGVTVTPATAEVQVDKDVQLEATLEPSNATDPIVWKSADETKATVSQTGKVTGVAETDGVKITAFADANENGTLDAGEFKAEATIKVTAGDVINYGTKEAPLTITQAKALLASLKGEMSKQPLFVKGVVSTNKAFDTQYHNGEIWLQSEDGQTAKDFELWSCGIDASLNYPGDPKADELKGYEVIAKGYGKLYNDTTYELTNTTIDGARVNPTIVSMTREEVVATGIAVAPTTAEVEVNKTVDLTATLTPDNATQKVAWKSSDEAKATVNDGKVRGVAEGNVTITAFVDADKDGVLDEGELKAECAVTVKPSSVVGNVLTLENLGHNLSTSSTAVTTETETTVNNYVLVYNNGKKQGESIFLTQDKGYIYNKTAMPGNIKSVTLYTNSGASGSAKYAIDFSATAYTEKAVGNNSTQVGGGASNEYACSVENARYFCITVSNKNGQVLKLEILYE